MRSFRLVFLLPMVFLRFLILLAVLVGTNAAAQDEPITLEAPGEESLDHRVFRAVYNYEGPAFSAAMRGVNIASYPAFYLVIPAVGLTDLIVDGDAGAGTRMLASELATMGVVFGLKNLIRRARPYAALPDVDRRPIGSHEPSGGIDSFSFPSGHAAISFAAATSASLSYPEWYVIVPAMTWASATAVARVWHGMHFPSDIVVGAVVGAGMGILVHELMATDDEQGIITSNATHVFSFTLEF